MKRFTTLVAVLLTLVMALSLAACGGGSEDPAPAGSTISAKKNRALRIIRFLTTGGVE